MTYREDGVHSSYQFLSMNPFVEEMLLQINDLGLTVNPFCNVIEFTTDSVVYYREEMVESIHRPEEHVPDDREGKHD